MKNSYLLQSSEVIRSFMTTHGKALARKVPWAITTETPIQEAMSLLFEDGYADLLILDAEDGRVLALLSNFETTTTFSSKKKREKKAAEMMEIQVACHEQCEFECQDRGGCKSHGAANYGGEIGWVCTIVCYEGSGTVGSTFPELQAL